MTLIHAEMRDIDTISEIYSTDRFPYAVGM